MKRFILPLFLLTKVVFANPTGETVAGGEVSFSKPSENELQVLQHSDRSIVEWQKFSIDAGELTKFIQPGKDSVLLNKVMGGDVSAIYGKLEANGQVILMNPHGVLVGKSGVIDACAFLASSHDVSNDAFMAGTWGFIPTDVTSVINIEGRIEANRVKIIGDQIFLTGELMAPGGEIEIKGREVGVHGHIDVSGEIDGGKASIWGDEMADFSGTILAEGGSGNGGFIEVSGSGQMNLVGQVSTMAPFGKAGMFLIDPTNVIISSGANMNTAGPGYNFTGSAVVINDVMLAGFLNGSPVTISTANTVDQGQAGNLTIAATANLTTWVAPNSLTLIVNNDMSVAVGAMIGMLGAGVGGSFIVRAGGDINIDAPIFTNGGDISLEAGPFSGVTGSNPLGSIFLTERLQTIQGGGLGGEILVEGYDISSDAVFDHVTNSGNIAFFASHDMPAQGFFFRGNPTIASTDTGYIHIYANGNITFTPGGFNCTGAFSGVQIDVRADYDLDGVGDLTYQGVFGNSNGWITQGGGGIFAGGNNVFMYGAEGGINLIGFIFFDTSVGGGNIEVESRNDFVMQAGKSGNGDRGVFMNVGGNTLIRAGNDIALEGGAAGRNSYAAIVSSALTPQTCEFIAGHSISFIGGTTVSAFPGSAGIIYPQVILTAGEDIIMTAKTGGTTGAPQNSAFIQSDLAPSIFRAGGSIICTNGPSNGTSTGYAGIIDNGFGFDVRAAGDIQWARSAHVNAGQSIDIEADVTLLLWPAQTGIYLTNTVLAQPFGFVGNDKGGYSVLTSPEAGGIEFVTVDGPITLYSAAHFLNGAVDNLVLDGITVTNATRVASATGNIQIGSFHNTDVNNTVSTAGAILIATDNTMNINTPSGFVTAGGPITLIVDEQTPVIASGGFFNNFNNGISTTDPQQRIAIYAASGPLPPAGFSFPNQVSLGNLSAVETWDFNLPLGLLSKYGTSFQAGGIVHGGGFGENYVAGVGKFSSPVIWYKVSIASILEEIIDHSLAALQELRTLVPERLWVQEFSILVDRQAFSEHVKAMMKHRSREETIQSRFVLASSKDYLMRSTMSGENIRLLDRYQEFEQSPFWRTPDMMDRLNWLEK